MYDCNRPLGLTRNDQSNITAFTIKENINFTSNIIKINNLNFKFKDPSQFQNLLKNPISQK